MPQQFLLGTGEIFTAADDAQAARMRDLGVSEASPADIKHDNLKQQYSSWEHGIAAAIDGFNNQNPIGALATGGVLSAENAISPEWGQTSADYLEGAAAAHPIPHAIGSVAGALAGGAAMKAFGAGKAAIFGAGAVQAGATALDDAAVHHIQTPEGSEKVGAILWSTVLGGVLNVATHSLFSALGGGKIAQVGASLEEKGAAGVASKSPLQNPGIQARLADKGATTDVMEFAQRHGLMSEAPGKVRAKVTDIIKASEISMNEAKSLSSETLPAAEHVKFTTELQQTLRGSGAENLAKKAGEGADLGDLHQLRIKLDGKIPRLTDQPLTPQQGQIQQARELVSGYMDKVLEHNAATRPELADLAERWRTANADYSAGKALQDALRFKEATGKSWVSRAAGKVAAAGATGAIFSTISGNIPAAGVSAATFAGAKGVQAAVDSAVIPATVQGLGKLMQAFDNTIVQAVVAGVEKTGGLVNANNLGPLAGKAFGLTDYNSLSTHFKWASENPTKAVPMAAQALESAGVPGQIIDCAVPQFVVGMQYLNSVCPKNPYVGQTVAPWDWQPTLAQKATFLEQANAVNNPVQALHNGSRAGLDAVKAVYPTLYRNVALMAGQEASSRPSIPLAARRWASAVTGLPASPLATPGARAVMAQADAQVNQPQGNPAQQRQGGKSNTITPDTQLNRMSQ